jgi:hypothetical protein
MNMKRMVGSVAAAVIGMGLASVPMTAEAAPAATTVSTAHVAAGNGVADRKKKKPKISVSVARDPGGCYDIALRVTKRHVPIAGALVRIQSLGRGKWRNTSDAPFRTDAAGAASFVNAGLHTSSGAASNHKIRFKYKHNYSRAFRAPCAG